MYTSILIFSAVSTFVFRKWTRPDHLRLFALRRLHLQVFPSTNTHIRSLIDARDDALVTPRARTNAGRGPPASRFPGSRATSRIGISRQTAARLCPLDCVCNPHRTRRAHTPKSPKGAQRSQCPGMRIDRGSRLRSSRRIQENKRPATWKSR